MCKANNGFPGGASDKGPTSQCRRWVGSNPSNMGLIPGLRRFPGGGHGHTLHGQRSLAGYSSQGHKESDVLKCLKTRLMISITIQECVLLNTYHLKWCLKQLTIVLSFAINPLEIFLFFFWIIYKGREEYFY